QRDAADKMDDRLARWRCGHRGSLSPQPTFARFPAVGETRIALLTGLGNQNAERDPWQPLIAATSSQRLSGTLVVPRFQQRYCTGAEHPRSRSRLLRVQSRWLG